MFKCCCTGPPVVILEPPNSYKSRWRSIRIMYLTMFMGSVTFTITVSSLWPFLQELDPSATPKFLGWVVAAYSLGQLIASPFFGTWANCRRSSREPLTVSLILTVLFNVLYMYLQSIPDQPQLYMILARGLIGFSAGSVAVVRSYISAATTLKERTACMANVSIFQALGFILGPVIQTCLVPLHFPGPVELSTLHINMYTAPAMFASILAFVNLILVVFVFKEHKVDGLEEASVATHIQREGEEQHGGTTNGHTINGEAEPLLDSSEDSKPDMIATFSTIFLFFVILFMFTVFETIGTPLSMHMYAWTKTEATLYQGIILGVSAATSIAVFVVTKILAKRFNERYLLLAGLVISFGAFLLFIPWGPNLPPLAFAPEGNASTAAPPGIGAEDKTDESIFNMRQGSHQLAFDPLSRGQRLDNLHHQEHLSSKVRSHDIIQEFSSLPSSRETISLDAFSPKQENKAIHQGQGRTLQNEKTKRSRGHSIHQFSIGSDVSGEEKQKRKDPNVFQTVNKNLFQILAMQDPSDNSSTVSTQPPMKRNTTMNAQTTASLFLSLNANMTTSTPPPNIQPNKTVSPEGCPWQYTWCRHVPALPLPQYLTAILIFSVGYPMCQMLSYTIYSKILGSQPQGVWMGWITAAGSLARTIGPIYVSQIYDMSGPQITFASVAGLILLTTVFYLIVFKRLVPCKKITEQENRSNST